MKFSLSKISFALLLALSISFWACSDEFLEVDPTGQLTPELLTSKAGIEGTLLGAYSMLGGRGNYFGGASNWTNGSIQGGDANKGTNSGDFNDINFVQRFELTPTARVPSDRWNTLYEGITRSNAVLKLLNTTTDPAVNAEVATGLGAQARFLRGHYYFQLKISYNNVPFIDETHVPGEGLEEVTNKEEIWPRIEADFQYAYDNLPETQSEVGRANKWAAGSYLAKTKLFRGDFAGAKALFDVIIPNGQTSNGLAYGLVDNYADLFNAETENNQEAIFAVQAAANTGTVNNANPDFVLNFPYNTGPSGPGNCCGFFQPSFELANSFRTTPDGLPLLDESYRDAANELETDQGILSDEPFTVDDKPVDPRLDHSVGRRDIPYLDWGPFPGFDWTRDQNYAGPYAPKKYVYYKSQEGTLTDGSSWTRGYGAMNYMIIRFADVLLMAAEAEIEAGTLEKAREYVNMVRTRAANSDYWVKNDDGEDAANYVISTYDDAWTDPEAARTAVRFERKIELSGEGHRFFDLNRWGIVADVMNTYLQYEGPKLPTALGGASFTSNKNEYYPIPQGQIDIQGSDVLVQNPGY